MPEPAPVLVLARPYGPEPVGIAPLIDRLPGPRRVVWVNLEPPSRPRHPLNRLRAGFRAGPLRPPRPGNRAGSRPAPSTIAADRTNATGTGTGGHGAANGHDHGHGHGSGEAYGPDPAGSRLTVLDPPGRIGGGNSFGRPGRCGGILRAIRAAIERLPEPPIVVTALPHTAELIDAFPARRWVYCMVEPDAAVLPPDLAGLEVEQLRRVDAVAAETRSLALRAAEAGREAVLLPPGVDPARWSPDQIDPPQSKVGRRVDALPVPRALYWGRPDAELDPRLLRSLADRWPGSIALLGPGGSRNAELAAIPRVHRPGCPPEDELPRIAALADVLILPQPAMPVEPGTATAEDAVHTGAAEPPPPQFLPYLATGRGTVCRDTPAVRRWADCCDVVAAERFADRVAQRAATGPSAEQLAARQRRLPAESWAARAERFEALLDAARPVIRITPGGLPGRRGASPPESTADRRSARR